MSPAASHYVARLGALETAHRIGGAPETLHEEVARLWDALTPEERATVPDGSGLMWTKSQRWATIDSLPSPGR
jgi:hypothetical protein